MRKVGFFKSIHFKIALVYVLLLLVAFQVIGVYFNSRLEEQFRTSFFDSIENRATFLSYSAAEQMKETDPEDEEALQDHIHSLLEDTDDLEEVQVISGNNQIVLGTSSYADRNNVGKKTTESLVKTVLLEREEKTNVYHDSHGERFYVLAKPIESESEDETLGVVYVKASMQPIYDQMDQISRIFGAGAVISLILTALLAVFLSRTITRPVSAMRKYAMQIAHGDFSKKVKVYGNDEIGHLATAFNQMTTRLKNANATTESERKKLRSVLAHMTDGVMAADYNGNIILMNNRAEEMLNVYRQNVFGTPLLSVLKVDEQWRWKELEKPFHTILLDFSDEENTQLLRANFSIVQKENDPTEGAIVVLHDVTEQEQIDAERREFVSNVSHELRTPLTTMKSYLEALGEGALYDEQLGPKFLDVTQNETERMIRLVNDLLKLSRMDANEEDFHFSKLDFVEFFHKVIDRFEMALPENIHFQRRLPSSEVKVSMDRDKMTQVLDNVISNALKYSPEGGAVTFEVDVFEHYLMAKVTDEGVGIPKSKVAKIFDRFFRVDKARSRRIGGTGLGLAIAREAIHSHGGEIWAESEWRQGTSICFTLPIATGKGGRGYELGNV